MGTNWDVILAGGGPAGFFAAIRCADAAQNPKLNVLIIEKASQTLGKVIISGGGRCNVTHACFEPAQLITYYPRGGNELRGVKLKVESDGRMFPVPDDSNTIADCLRGSAREAGVRVELRTSLLKVD